MRQSPRIQKKVQSYSYLCKCLGIINEAEYKQITSQSPAPTSRTHNGQWLK
jgi:hypothetical protein